MREAAQAGGAGGGIGAGAGQRGRRPMRPDPDAGPVEAFADRLWRLKVEAGDPSFAEMSAQLGAAASKSSLAAAAQGRTLASWGTTWEFVRVLAVGRLGHDEKETEREWRELWRRTKALAELGTTTLPNTIDLAVASPPGPETNLASAGEAAADTGKAEAPTTEAVSGVTGTIGGTAGAVSGTAETVSGAAGTVGGVAAEAVAPAAGAEVAGTVVSAPTSRGSAPTSRGTGATPRSGAGPERDMVAARRVVRVRRLRLNASGLIAVAAFAVLVVALGGAAFLLEDRPAPKPPAAQPALDVDDSVFEGDITYPDGTLVQQGESFEKIWRLRNTGTVAWEDRFLMRANEAICTAPDRVEIPRTHPGESVDIRVLVRAPKKNGTCRLYWKMVDRQGRTLFPGKRPIFLDVRIG